MCLMPVSLVNPKKRLSLYGGISYKMEVPCGHCVECEKQKQSEWYFRAYYESKYTIDNGGYVYFDTLTYAPNYLPHMSDVIPELKGRLIDNSCFNHEHYRLFFVNLRRQLEYHGFDVKNKLKYFLTSEYGVDDRFTHRPHYHVLFYILDSSLDPITLSEYVAKCWQYGRTDGAPYKGSKYVLDHVFGNAYNCDSVHLQSICNYVAKYVTKDNKFQKVLDSRLNAVRENFYNGELSRYEEEKFKKLKREVNQFHRQSNGFGESFVLYNDMEEVFNTGMIKMPDKNNVVKHIPLPGYFHRKLHYELVKDYEGKLKWVLNEKGKLFKLNRKFKAHDLMKDKFVSWHINMRDHNLGLKVGYNDEGHVWTQEEVDDWYDSKVRRFDELLGDRNIMEFVIYLLDYKGRIKSPEEVAREEAGIFKVDDLESFIMREYAIEQDFGYKQVYNFAHHCYKKIFGCQLVSDRELVKDEDGGKVLDSSIIPWITWKSTFELTYDWTPSALKSTYSRTRKQRIFGNMQSVDSFSYKYVINDKADLRFKDFDKMYSIWCDSLVYVNENKQKFHDWKKEVRDRLKSQGMLSKSV